MDAWLLALLGTVLGLLGGWTVRHPDGGYRAVGGAGSGLSAEVRRFAGVVMLAMGAAAVVAAAFAL